MQIVGKRMAVTVAAIGAVTLCVPGTAAAADAPAVSASSIPGSITVDFDFRGVDVVGGVTCVTYVSTRQSGLDAVDPSGRADAQAPGSRFSIENTSTSAATFAEDGNAVSVGPQPITAGTYFVYWGCRDAANMQWDNVSLDSGTPFTNPIVVEVAGDSTAPGSAPDITGDQPKPKPDATTPPTGSSPDNYATIDTPEELIAVVIELFQGRSPVPPQR